MTKISILIALSVLVSLAGCSQSDNKTKEAKPINQTVEDKAALQIEKGKQLYKRCTSCHSPAYNRTGPKHCDLLGREIGSLADYEYSAAMRQKNKKWNKQNLNAFLESPSRYIPGTSMQVIGLSSAEDRELLINFLAALTPENPKCQKS